MADENDGEVPDRDGVISRRRFIPGALMTALAVAHAAAFDAPVVAASSNDAAAVLTANQRRLLVSVLNHLIPADGVMPGAGDVGVARFIDEVLAEAPHLRHHVIDVLSALEQEGAGTELTHGGEQLLERIEQQFKTSFDVLIETAYTGYYSHPEVLAVLGSRTGEVA